MRAAFLPHIAVVEGTNSSRSNLPTARFGCKELWKRW